MVIRHAESKINHAYNKVYGDRHKEKEVISDLNFLDPELSEDGIEQANKQAEVAKLTEFTTVLVSPLRRALETAYLLFKDTNYFNSLKFVIVPILREQIYSVAEIPQNF